VRARNPARNTESTLGGPDPTVLDDALLRTPRRLSWPLACIGCQRCWSESSGDADSCHAHCWREAQEELRGRLLKNEPVEGLGARSCPLYRPAAVFAVEAAADPDLAPPGAGGGRPATAAASCTPTRTSIFLVLVPAPLAEAGRASVERLVSIPVGHRPGGRHSVRTVAECPRRVRRRRRHDHANGARRPGRLGGSWCRDARWAWLAIASGRCASSSRPVREQHDRRLKANDTAYNLEPTFQTGPGGLRDIQTIAWVAKRQFWRRIRSTTGHLTAFLAPSETAAVDRRRRRSVEGTLRTARADRPARGPVLFDYQIKLAGCFGYEDCDLYALAVEQLMQRLLPHLHRRHAAQRAAAAAVPRGDSVRRPVRHNRSSALPGAPTTTWRRSMRTCRPPPVGAARRCRAAAAESADPRRAGRTHPRGGAQSLDCIDGSSARTRDITGRSSRVRAPRGVTHELRA